MTNEEILEQEFAKVGATGILGKTGKIYQAILNAMEAIRPTTNTAHPYSQEEVDENDRLNRIARNNIFGQIVDEDGEAVPYDFLVSMFANALSEADFLKRVNYGITNDYHSVSEMNDHLIMVWYERFYHDEVEPSPKGRYFKGEKTLKALALDFVEENGPCTSTEIRRFMFETSNPDKTFDPVRDRGWYSSYFSAAGHYRRTPIEARFNVPSKDDYRVLEKKDNGTYFVVDLG